MTEQEIIERILAIKHPIYKYVIMFIPKTHYNFYINDSHIIIIEIGRALGERDRYMAIPPELEEYFKLKNL